MEEAKSSKIGLFAWPTHLVIAPPHLNNTSETYFVWIWSHLSVSS